MFFDRSRELLFKPTFEADSEPPLNGLWFVRLTTIAVFKKSKKGSLYLSWPVEIVQNEAEEKVEGYREIEWMLFFQDEVELLEILEDRFGLSKETQKTFLEVYFGGSFVDGKEPVVLPQGYSHKPLLVEITPGFTPKHRNLRIAK